MEQLRFFAMGCEILAVLDCEGPQVSQILEQVPEWFSRWEMQFSRFQPTSELSFVNQNAGSWTVVSPDFMEVLQLALAGYDTSGGLVLPTMLPALLVAGYQESFDLLEKDQYARSEIGRMVTDPDLIGLALQTCSVRIPVGMQLDFGGIAKGWAAQQAAERLSSFGPALVNAGGDIAVGDLRQDGQPWQIGIADPFNEGADLETIGVARMGVATSGTNRRRWRKNGNWQHHLIDPRTKQPVESDILTATVFAPSVCEAEVAAKTVLILGSQDGIAWLEDHPGLYGMAVLNSRETIYNSRLEKLRSVHVS